MESIQINIAEPCHENWQHMTSKEQGRFCNACAKTVVDFTIMTDTQVLNYLLDKKGEKLCGRFLSGQLDTEISTYPLTKSKKSWPWNIVLSLFLFLTKPGISKAQNTAPVNITEEQLNRISPSIKVGLISQRVTTGTGKILKGKIVDVEGNPVPFAVVKINSSGEAVSANEVGDFSVKVKEGELLTVTGTGFVTKIFKVVAVKDARIVLEYQRFQLGDYVVTTTTQVQKRKIETQQPVIITRDYDTKEKIDALIRPMDYNRSASSFVSVSKGKFRCTKINKGDSCKVKVQSEGYDSRELTIVYDMNRDRGQLVNVYLKKKTTQPVATRLENQAAGAASIRRVRSTINKEQVIQKETQAEPGLIIAGGISVAMPVKSVNPSITNNPVLNKSKNLAVYPNPAVPGGIITMEGSTKPGDYTITVFDSAGMLLLNIRTTGKQFKIQTGNNWNAGTYYFKVANQAGSQVETGSFILQ